MESFSSRYFAGNLPLSPSSESYYPRCKQETCSNNSISNLDIHQTKFGRQKLWYLAFLILRLQNFFQSLEEEQKAAKLKTTIPALGLHGEGWDDLKCWGWIRSRLRSQCKPKAGPVTRGELPIFFTKLTETNHKLQWQTAVENAIRMNTKQI